MKIFVKLLLLLTLINFCVYSSEIKSADEYIKIAKEYQSKRNLEEAVKILRESIVKFPDNPSLHAYLGLYLGMMAGQTQDFMKAGSLIEDAYNNLDRAISLDPESITARFYRGLLSIQVPEFLGKLDSGIEDFEIIIKIYDKYPDRVPDEILTQSCDFLSIAYQKKGEIEKSITFLEKIIEIAPESPLAKRAEETLRKIAKPSKNEEVKKEIDSETIQILKDKVENNPENVEYIMKLGLAYYNEDYFDEAESAFKRVLTLDSLNAEAYKWLAFCVARKGEKGYDKRIYFDTNFLTNIVFQSMEYFDKAVSLSPDDIELRYLRGMLGVNFPFFVGKMEQGIEDLKIVINSDAHDSLKSSSLYWLGFAYKKKGTTQWLDIVKKYPHSRASDMVYDDVHNLFKYLDQSEYKSPFVSVEFTLGFKDELPPQTAVWIEDNNGKFIKTLYVSGFSGYAKEKQVNLPRWAKSSDYFDTDAITGASVDLGQHIYIWYLKDYKGNEIKKGEYTVKVEVSYWPSMKYQISSTNITIGKKEDKKYTEEGNLIPYMRVTYHP